jgi:hypothetical protein
LYSYVFIYLAFQINLFLFLSLSRICTISQVIYTHKRARPFWCKFLHLLRCLFSICSCQTW